MFESCCVFQISSYFSIIKIVVKFFFFLSDFSSLIVCLKFRVTSWNFVGSSTKDEFFRGSRDNLVHSLSYLAPVHPKIHIHIVYVALLRKFNKTKENNLNFFIRASTQKDEQKIGQRSCFTTFCCCWLFVEIFDDFFSYFSIFFVDFCDFYIFFSFSSLLKTYWSFVF